MKSTLRILGLLSFAFILNSCKQLKDLVSINLPLEIANVSFSLPPLEAGTAENADVAIYLNVDSLIKEEASNMSVENIKSVKLVSCSITVSNPTPEDHFGTLTACAAGLAADQSPTFVTVAELTNNPDTYATTLSLPVKADQELKDYFRSTHFTYRISASSRRATSTTLNCKATIKFKAEVSL